MTPSVHIRTTRKDVRGFCVREVAGKLVSRLGFTMGLVGPCIPSKNIQDPAEIACILVAQALQMPVPKPGCSTCL